MATIPGSFGRVRIFEDFLGFNTPAGNTAWALLGVCPVGQLSMTSVNEGSLAPTFDEPGGIMAITTDTGDNDNAALFAGVFKPADGGCVMEARFKVANVTTAALYCGFSETLALDTPVMPAEFATATMTYGGAGSIIGASFDPDGTTADWRAVFGDGGAVKSNADANGTRAYQTVTNDYWQIVRVEIGADGDAWVYVNGKLIKTIKDACTTTDVQHAVLMVENRSGAANILEVDYFYAEGARDWADD